MWLVLSKRRCHCLSDRESYFTVFCRRGTLELHARRSCRLEERSVCFPTLPGRHFSPSLPARACAVELPLFTPLPFVASAEAAHSHRKDRPLTAFSIADAAERAGPSVVNITALKSGRLNTILGVASSGSGFFVDSDGTVITNAHVVADAAGRSREAGTGGALTVTLSDGRTFEGEVEALDTVSDIAVVKLVGAKGPFPAAVLGSSADLRTGEWVRGIAPFPHHPSAGLNAHRMSQALIALTLSPAPLRLPRWSPWETP